MRAAYGVQAYSREQALPAQVPQGIRLQASERLTPFCPPFIKRQRKPVCIHSNAHLVLLPPSDDQLAPARLLLI